MKRLKSNEENINTRQYWNYIYGDAQHRAEYAAQGTCLDGAAIVGNYLVKPTTRFNRAAEEIRSGERVLDIGCGVGVFTKLVKSLYPNCEIWGTDISDKAMKDNTLENPLINYRTNTIGNLKDIPLGYFDVVFSGETLEHLDDPNDLFKDAYKCLKPGGRFIVTTPNGSNVKSTEHVWEFTHDDVENLFFTNGFERVRFIYLPDMEHLFVIVAVGYKK